MLPASDLSEILANLAALNLQTEHRRPDPRRHTRPVASDRPEFGSSGSQASAQAHPGKGRKRSTM
jgi:hypothetical protein